VVMAELAPDEKVEADAELEWVDSTRDTQP
jgi:hypothetical protein